MKHISKRISVILLSTVICCVFCESTVFALSKIGSQGQEVTNMCFDACNSRSNKITYNCVLKTKYPLKIDIYYIKKERISYETYI